MILKTPVVGKKMHIPRYKPPTQKMSPSVCSYTFLRCSQADKQIRIQPYALRVSLLHIPSGWYVNRDNREARVSEEGQGDIKGGTYGGLEGEAEDSVEDDIRRLQGGAERLDVIGRRQGWNFHVVTLSLQTLGATGLDQTRRYTDRLDVPCSGLLNQAM